jgi:hypothetical protein
MAHRPNHPAGNSLFYPGDTSEISRIICETIKRKFFVSRPSRSQLKHRAINFYPSTGKITIDGEASHPEKGAEAFWSLLQERYGKSTSQTQKAPLTSAPTMLPASAAPSIDDSDLPW